MRLLKWFAVIVVVAVLGFQVMTWNHHRSMLPPDLGIWLRTYAQNRTWGFGPGGNETGFNAFLLPAAAADRVRTGGSDLLAALTPGVDWHETPVPQEKPWLAGSDDPAQTQSAGSVTILAYLDRYGFAIDLPERRRARFDAAIRAPGSYYSFGRGGRIVVVSPPQRRAWVAYAG